MTSTQQQQPTKVRIKVPLSTYVTLGLRERMERYIQSHKPMTIVVLVNHAIREYLDTHN